MSQRCPARKGETRPWFKLWARDFLSSGKVAKMGAAERGAYFTILLRSWVEDGYRLDEEDLADELGMPPEEVRTILAGRVGRCFYQDDEGLWRNERLEHERSEAEAQAEVSRVNGAKGGRPRKPNGTQRNPVGTQANPEEPSRTQGNPAEPRETCPVSASVSVSGSCESPTPEDSPTAVPTKKKARKRARVSASQRKSLDAMRGALIQAPVELSYGDVRSLMRWAREMPKQATRGAATVRGYSGVLKRIRNRAAEKPIWDVGRAVERSLIAGAWRQPYDVDEPAGTAPGSLVPGSSTASVNPAALSYRVQNELINEKNRRENDEWVAEMERERRVAPTIDANGGPA